VRYQFVDCRWELGQPERGRHLYLEGHIPGASFLDVEQDLSDLSLEDAGRYPVPSAERFAAAASRAGIGPDTLVVAYDQGASGGAARLWWLLRHFGHADVAVLDGGIGAWLGPLTSGEEAIEAVSSKRVRAAATRSTRSSSRAGSAIGVCSSSMRACRSDTGETWSQSIPSRDASRGR
jgi:3-mercaptopyruvate sulfurtransferase SseA